MPLTDEQEKIVACSDPLIVVNAYAGTGKTSTLCEYAKHRPRKRFLYLAYNKAMQTEAAERFPSNATASTTHSVAYRAVGHKYKTKLGDLRPIDISDEFGVDYRQAKLAIETLQSFFSSADSSIKEEHLPIDVLSKSVGGKTMDLAKKMWLAAVDRQSGVAMPHDGYLKLYAMTKTDLSDRFDVILFDEAQDANPVTSQIVFNQHRLQKIVVGDRYQSIYGFRGAVNAMEALSESQAAHFHLTKSFRFGQDVADLASLVLKIFHEEQRPLIGMRDGRSESKIDASKPYAHIHRTNSDLLRSAAWCAERNIPFSLLGGVSAYAFDRIIDAYHLYAGNQREIKDGLIRRFDDFSSFVDYAEAVNDIPLKGVIKLVEEYKKDIPFMVSLVKRKAIDVQDPTSPPVGDLGKKGFGLVTLTTAHRSKGLGFDQVLLSNDFHNLFDRDTDQLITPSDRQEAEEINLIYVAITRAKSTLHLNDDLERLKRELGHTRMPESSGRTAFSLV